MSSALATAQDLIVKGSVRTSDGEGTIGATVMEKGTRNGTVTDLDGNFSIAVSGSTATLVISYVGYSPIEVKANGNLNIVLEEDSQLLDEVVVTGYTTQRKADLTGAVSVMNMKNPISEADPNMLSSMQGKLAGVQIVTDPSPGSSSSSVRIRGMSTVNGNDPLYIIDGVATTENLNSLNPADIESMQVLKDASSASIYGSRAANGVIIITTKKGKGDRLSVSLNYTASVQTIAKTYDVLNSQQWGEAYWTASTNAGITPSHVFYGSGSTPQLVSYLDSDGLVKASDTDWQDAVYRSAVTQNFSASVSNSSDKGSVMFSANYINQDGVMNYTYYRRYSVRLNSTYKISKYFGVGENLMVAKWNNLGYTTNTDRGISYSAMRQHPAIPVYDSNGDFTSPLELVSSDIYNPVHELYSGRDNDSESWRIFGNAYLEIYPVKGLTLKSNIGIEHLQYYDTTLTRAIEESESNSVYNAYGQGDTWTWTNTANYNFNIGNHRVNVLAGTEATKYVYKNLSGTRKDYAFEDADYMVLDAGEGTQTNSGSKSEWALFSLFAKADYNYADKYLFSATIRRDATSRLYSDNNSGVFPAFSAAWRISQEKFFPKSNTLSDVKIRLGWGQNGNSAISNNYASYSVYAYNTGTGSYDLNGTNTNTVTGITVSSSGNKDLKWETTTQTNLGLDFKMFNNNLNVSFDYYWKLTKDMLTEPPTLAVDGENATIWMNTGDMRNTGFEITIDYNSPTYSNGISWAGSLNVSKYKNKVVKLNDYESSIGSEIRLMEGQPMGVYYGYVCDGIFQSEEEVSSHATQEGGGVGRLKFRDLNNDGVIDEDDQCIIGDPNPDLSVGLNLSVSWKGFTLSTFLTGEFGFDIYNSTKKQLDFFSYGGTNTNHGTSTLNAWTESNTSATVPALSLSDDNNEVRMSTYFIEDGSYVKMKYLKLAYDFPSKWIKCFGARSLSAYVQAENIFTITGYSGLDPEVPLSTYGSRVDNAPYPRSRTFTFGVNVQF